MLDCSRALTPEGALRTANDLLGKARESDNHKMARKACGRAKNALSRIKSSEKKRLLSSLNTEDQVLCNDVAKTYHEIGDQLEKSAQAEAQAKAKAKAQAKVLSSYKDEEIWR
ncbi:hypothetical protein EDD21DRAFT_348799 [Dissophora ornata]|nr:hypothetical protein EDD21DRAFT_348799 [Dissophora ornata]